MPDPRDHDQKDGGTLPPELDRAGPAATREDAEDEATPGLGENQAGFVKDRDLAPGGKETR